MESNLHHNAVITGYVDAYCLICESVHRPENAFNHIDKPVHKKNLDAAPYVEKYKDEHIRKVKKGYYCEFCNVLFPTTTKVHLHIAEAIHIQNKGAPVVKRIGDYTVALNDICINEKVWNGLIEDVCALCNLEFLDEKIHRAEQSHILNLIQKKVEFVDKKAVYRMIDSDSFHCLTCNEIIALSTFETHVDEGNHKKIFQKCRNGLPKAPQSEPLQSAPLQSAPLQSAPLQSAPPQSEPSEQNDRISMKNEKVSKNIKPNDTPQQISKKSTLETPNIQQTQKTSNKNNGKTNKNEPKHESKTNVNVTEKMEDEMRSSAVKKPTFDQNHNDTDNHPPSRKEKAQHVTPNLSELPKDLDKTLATSESPKETSSKKEIDNQIEFAKEHKLTYNKDNNSVYCRLCNVRLPASLKSMKEHVNGVNHKKLTMKTPIPKTTPIPKKIPIPKYTTILTNDFVREVCIIEDGRFGHVILNSKLCLSVLSYAMITNYVNTVRCQACEVNLTDDIGDHLASQSHENSLRDTPVVLNQHDEFFREVRPGLFHCGFCNLIVGLWENVSIHLQCVEHVKNKVLADRYLRETLPSVLNFRQSQLRLTLSGVERERQSEVLSRFVRGMF